MSGPFGGGAGPDPDEDDDIEEGGVIRSFIVTHGRTTAKVAEIPIEALISATLEARLRAAELQFEARRIVTEFHQPSGLAEISAILSIPLRATQVLVSELVEKGALVQHDTARRDDVDMLLRIRSALISMRP